MGGERESQTTNSIPTALFGPTRRLLDNLPYHPLYCIRTELTKNSSAVWRLLLATLQANMTIRVPALFGDGIFVVHGDSMPGDVNYFPKLVRESGSLFQLLSFAVGRLAK